MTDARTNAATWNVDSRRRLLWEITMAGGYQAASESVENGLDGDAMTMTDGYRYLRDFFAAFDWWKMEPRPDLAGGALCLAEPGVRYVVYLPDGSQPVPEVATGPGRWHTRWYNPRTGEFTHSPNDNGDWAILLTELRE